MSQIDDESEVTQMDDEPDVVGLFLPAEKYTINTITLKYDDATNTIEKFKNIWAQNRFAISNVLKAAAEAAADVFPIVDVVDDNNNIIIDTKGADFVLNCTISISIIPYPNNLHYIDVIQIINYINFQITRLLSCKTKAEVTTIYSMLNNLLEKDIYNGEQTMDFTNTRFTKLNAISDAFVTAFENYNNEKLLSIINQAAEAEDVKSTIKDKSLKQILLHLLNKITTSTKTYMMYNIEIHWVCSQLLMLYQQDVDIKKSVFKKIFNTEHVSDSDAEGG
jgi:hypothetical protein